MEYQTAEERKPVTFGTVFFFISFIPYLIILYISFHGMPFGMQGFGWFYGFYAMLFSMFYFIPLGGPFFVIYQICYACKNFKHPSTAKTAATAITFILIAAALLSGFCSELSKDNQINQAEDYGIRSYFISHNIPWDAGAYAYCYSRLEEKYCVTSGGQTYVAGRNSHNGFYVIPVDPDEVDRFKTENNIGYDEFG